MSNPSPTSASTSVPMSTTALSRGWLVVAAGMSVNLCLGILYAWSVWKATLVGNAEHPAGTPMSGLNVGWSYLSDANATWAYTLCGLTFAICMIPGGRLQDRYGPRIGVTLGGLSLALGCIIAGLSKNFVGLLVGFGLFGGIGMGLGYAAATPAAVKWFGPHRRGLIVGLVVGGYGGAAIYIAPLAKYLIGDYGLTGSFVGLGVLFALVIVIAGRLLVLPPSGFVPAGTPTTTANSVVSRTPREMLRTREYVLLVLLMFGASQSGILVIANAASLLKDSAKGVGFLERNAWVLAAFGGVVNAIGRVGTGFYSDRIGRRNAYAINALAAIVGLIALPFVVESRNLVLVFVTVGIAFWQYGGGLSLLPAFTADLFGPKHLGVNYGLVFLGWGLAFVVPLAAGYIKDATGNVSTAYFISAAILFVCVVLSRVIKTK